MRTIIKADQGNHNLDNAVKNNGIPASAQSAQKAWSNFKDHDNSLFHQLLTEQYGLCCYTELNMADLKAIHNVGSHFEHEQPKSRYPQRTFDAKNLLRCALDSSDLSTYSGNSRFGGHFKDNNQRLIYDETRFISPQSPNCRAYFSYLSHDGSIVPNYALTSDDQDKAQYTIDLLNLNAPFLKAERVRYLDEINGELNRLIDENALEAIEAFAQCELTLTERLYPGINKGPLPQLRPFHSATLALFGHIGRKVIHQHDHAIE